jgi:hypothetical protein
MILDIEKMSSSLADIRFPVMSKIAAPEEERIAEKNKAK